MSKGLEQVLLNRDNPRDSRDRKKFKTSAAEADSAVFVQEDGIDVNLAMPHELAMLRRDPDRVQFHDTCWGDDEYINEMLYNVVSGDDRAYDDTYAERKLLHITKAGIPTSYITNYPGSDVPLVPGPRLRKLERRPVGGADTSEWYRVKSRIFRDDGTPRCIELDSSSYNKLCSQRGTEAQNYRLVIDEVKHIAESIHI
jgi:hypothetical protein